MAISLFAICGFSTTNQLQNSQNKHNQQQIINHKKCDDFVKVTFCPDCSKSFVEKYKDDVYKIPHFLNFFSEDFCKKELEIYWELRESSNGNPNTRYKISEMETNSKANLFIVTAPDFGLYVGSLIGKMKTFSKIIFNFCPPHFATIQKLLSKFIDRNYEITTENYENFSQKYFEKSVQSTRDYVYDLLDLSKAKNINFMSSEDLQVLKSASKILLNMSSLKFSKILSNSIRDAVSQGKIEKSLNQKITHLFYFLIFSIAFLSILPHFQINNPRT